MHTSEFRQPNRPQQRRRGPGPTQAGMLPELYNLKYERDANQ
jgi:hypothetical protein